MTETWFSFWNWIFKKLFLIPQIFFIEITFRHECSLVNLQHIFRTPFYKNNYGGLRLDIHHINSSDQPCRNKSRPQSQDYTITKKGVSFVSLISICLHKGCRTKSLPLNFQLKDMELFGKMFTKNPEYSINIKLRLMIKPWPLFKTPAKNKIYVDKILNKVQRNFRSRGNSMLTLHW